MWAELLKAEVSTPRLLLSLAFFWPSLQAYKDTLVKAMERRAEALEAAAQERVSERRTARDAALARLAKAAAGVKRSGKK